MYDFAHPLSDAIERITHSLCTLEFEDHRPLYDWLVSSLSDAFDGDLPQQIEFARLNLNYTVMSKRKLLQLVQLGHVSGWDDPRMPTISGLRRRGYTPESIRDFCTRIGIAKKENVIDMAQLEHCIREDLNRHAQRVMAVLRPLKVVITNYPEGQVEEVDVINNPEDPSAGTRKVPFSRVLYIEQDDFMEEPPKKFFRLSPGREVRLRCAYFITCTEVVKSASGEILELRCTYDPATRGGDSPDGRKVKATLHWVSAAHAGAAEVRLYDRLFLGGGSRAGRARGHVPRQPQPAVARSAQRVRDRAEPRRRDARLPVPVRAPGLLLGRRRVASRRAHVQPHRVAARRVGQARPEIRQLMEYHITQYDLEQGALEIQYIEEFFGEFPRKKTAAEIVRRLSGRAHLILLANAPLGDDSGTVVPVSFKVAHEIQSPETEPKLNDLVDRLRDHVAVRRPEGALHVDRRHQARLARARATSARSPSSRKSGRSSRVSTRSSSRRRTGSTRCAARSITCASKSSNTNATRRTTPSRRCISARSCTPKCWAPTAARRQSCR